ncbi:TetR/AcrR family transcriptional regulator [Flavobacteriaceae bacterium 3-367]|uniref:TetR/AcrR family transcriptional regulator n=1 Tax=Eudoraea algarum TaxID=3417568 RepID=UPI0032950173
MPRQKQYDEEAVIEKAVQVFWKHGYAGTSIRELESKMGINQFSIYSSFGSKKGVFLRALANYKRRVKEIFLSDLLNSDGRLEDIRKFLEAFVDSVRSGRTPNGCLMANTAMDLDTHDQEVKVQLTLFFELLQAVFLEVLTKAKARGELSPQANINQYANYLLGCTEGLAVTAKVLEKEQLEDFIAVTMAALK